MENAYKNVSSELAIRVNKKPIIWEEWKKTEEQRR